MKIEKQSLGAIPLSIIEIALFFPLEILSVFIEEPYFYFVKKQKTWTRRCFAFFLVRTCRGNILWLERYNRRISEGMIRTVKENISLEFENGVTYEGYF